jgi:ribosomal protein L7Ae-like RNA K-turn-binding protein
MSRLRVPWRVYLAQPDVSEPFVSVQLSNTILDIVQQAVNFQQLKKGANEGVKLFLHRWLGLAA